jgi:hypothetical protein
MLTYTLRSTTEQMLALAVLFKQDCLNLSLAKLWTQQARQLTATTDKRQLTATIDRDN